MSRTCSSLIRAQSISSQIGLVQEAQSFESSLSANLIASVCFELACAAVMGKVQTKPFLIFRYHVGPPTFTIVFVTHSRSERGILQTFSVISAARVGRGCSKCRNLGRKGKMSLGWRLWLNLPISRTCMLGVAPPPAPSLTMIPAVRKPSY